jgi:hypothetical protein
MTQFHSRCYEERFIEFDCGRIHALILAEFHRNIKKATNRRKWAIKCPIMPALGLFGAH